MPERTFKCALLANRHHGLPEGLRGLLETALDSVVMVANVTSLLTTSTRLRFEAVLMDPSRARQYDRQWQGSRRQSCPDLTWLVPTVHDEPRVRQAALDAGADGFVLKRAVTTELLPAVDAALQRKGESPVVPDKRADGQKPRAERGGS